MKSNNIIIGALAIAVIVMSVAFAAFSTSLKINGTANIASTWGPITITSCSCTSTTAKDTAHPSSATCTPASNGSTVTGTITANMVSPGDVVTCTFNTKNAGTLIAGVPTLSVNPTSNTYFTVAASGGTCIKASNGTGSFKTTITYKDVTSAPTSSQTFTVTAAYKQAATCA